jgi:hypothetical protein
MKKIIIVFAFLAFSCDEGTEYRVDTRLAQYVENFFNEADSRGFHLRRDNLIMVSVPGLRHSLPDYGEVLALCGTDPKTGQITIQIDEEHLLSGDSLCIESTVFHEMGHGFLGRRDVSIGYTIMNGRQYGCFNRRVSERDSLINELFANQGK